MSRLLLLAALALGACAPPAREARRAEPVRNVVVLLGDDHAAYALGAYGSPVAKTPSLDRLAAQGTRFDRAFANAPVCTPSRQSMLTGRLPHATGVNLLYTPLARTEVTFADHLGRHGVRTAAIGKMHFNANPDALRGWGYPDSLIALADPKHGFDVRIDRADLRRHRQTHPPRAVPEATATRPPWRPFRDPARIWLNADVLPSATYEADSEAAFFADRAVDFLEAHRDERFGLWLSFYEPHSPFNFPVEYAGRFDPAAMPLPAAGSEDARWVPEIFRDVTDADTRGIAAAYYTSVAHLDRQIGRVLDALDRLGLAEHTLVVYAGDHGYLLGHHDRFEKHMMWDEAVRVPLLIRHPAHAPRTTDALVELIDLVPTALDALGLPPLEAAEGRSLLPVVAGHADRHRDHVFSEYLGDDKAMVRTERWKYVYTAGRRDLGQGYATGYGASGPLHRLYDLVADPGETTNVAGDPAHAEVLRTLKATMRDRFRSHQHFARLPAGLTLDEELAWLTRPPDPTPSVEVK